MMTNPPLSCMYEGKELAFWTYAQLHQLSSGALKQRGLNVRDVLGDLVGRMPRDKENCIVWIISSQIKANEVTGGDELTLGSFGLPKELAAQGLLETPRAPAEQSPGQDQATELAGSYNQSKAAYDNARTKNRLGSNIFG